MHNNQRCHSLICLTCAGEVNAALLIHVVATGTCCELRFSFWDPLSEEPQSISACPWLKKEWCCLLIFIIIYTAEPHSEFLLEKKLQKLDQELISLWFWILQGIMFWISAACSKITLSYKELHYVINHSCTHFYSSVLYTQIPVK